MKELSKQEYRDAKEVLKKGLLRLHEQWLEKLGKVLSRPLDGKENAFDRSMEITKMSKNWYLEASQMEKWYKRSLITGRIAVFLEDGVLTEEETAHLSDDVKAEIAFFREW